jgi:hypothetical protein
VKNHYILPDHGLVKLNVHSEITTLKPHTKSVELVSLHVLLVPMPPLVLLVYLVMNSYNQITLVVLHVQSDITVTPLPTDVKYVTLPVELVLVLDLLSV